MIPIYHKPAQGERRRESVRPVYSDSVERDGDGIPIDPKYVRELLPIHNVSRRPVVTQKPYRD